jgi:hypothetical protein
MLCSLGGSWREILGNSTELQTDKVLLRALIIRPPQELVAGLEKVDLERWANRRDLLRRGSAPGHGCRDCWRET